MQPKTITLAYLGVHAENAELAVYRCVECDGDVTAGAHLQPARVAELHARRCPVLVGYRHTCNDGRGPAFGRRTPGCPRCDELEAGAPARRPWRGLQRGPTLAEIRAHRCDLAGCGPVCTFGDP